MKLLKHKNCKDVAIAILRDHVLNGVHHVKVRWFNVVNPGNIFDMGLPVEHLMIKDENMKDWKEVVDAPAKEL